MKSCPQCANSLKLTDIGGKDRLACLENGCDFVHWDNPKPVTATLITTEGGLVLVKRKFEPFVGDWCLPGGFIEATEHPEESAAREVLEETGLIVRVDKLVGASAPGRGINVIILFYSATALGGDLIAGDDASDVGAFRTTLDLPENICFALHREMIERYYSGNGQF